ncbi:MAG: response regulator transcription factor [Chloroflexi bacterium]|nr:response regulator transcription factor [Chloroflexota bacterium]
MTIPDAFAPYVYIILLVVLAFVLFLCYRLWQFVQQLIYRVTHRPPKTFHFSSQIPVRLVPEREWTFEPESDDPSRVEASERQGQASDSEELTEREKEVAQLALEGKSNKAIAKKLNISVGTVENHMTNIHRKLGIESRKELKYVPRDRLS